MHNLGIQKVLTSSNNNNAMQNYLCNSNNWVLQRIVSINYRGLWHSPNLQNNLLTRNYKISLHSTKFSKCVHAENL